MGGGSVLGLLNHVLSWKIRASQPDTTMLEFGSWLLAAENGPGSGASSGS
jgi:hypothetical protein